MTRACLTEHGSIGGHGSYATITVRPEALPKLLPEDTGKTLSENQIVALNLFVQIRGGVRREYARQNGLRYAANDPVFESLIDLGLIKANKAGAMKITTAGRNAVRGLRRYI